MAQVRPGDTVKLHFTGRLDDGRVFASSRTQGPLELRVGQDRLIPGLEETVASMQPGEERTVTIPAERAYGPHKAELVFEVDRTEFPSNIEPVIGQELQVRQGDEVVVVKVAGVSEEQVTIDANHPLAGENLTFDLELIDVENREVKT